MPLLAPAASFRTSGSGRRQKRAAGPRAFDFGVRKLFRQVTRCAAEAAADVEDALWSRSTRPGQHLVDEVELCRLQTVSPL